MDGLQLDRLCWYFLALLWSVDGAGAGKKGLGTRFPVKSRSTMVLVPLLEIGQEIISKSKKKDCTVKETLNRKTCHLQIDCSSIFTKQSPYVVFETHFIVHHRLHLQVQDSR